MNGNDSWSGTLAAPNADGTDGPFASLARARDAIRALRAGSGGLPPGGVEAIVQGGEYRLAEPLEFTAEDSGTAEAPIVNRSAEGETVRLSGGARIADWTPVTDAEALKRLPLEARGHVLQADLRAQGVSDFGVMESARAWAQSDPGLEVFFRGERMTLARYPNEGFLHIAGILAEDGPEHFSTRSSKVGRFRIEGEADRLRRWAADPGAMLHGWWALDWADQRYAIARIAPETGEITLDDRIAHPYGFRAGQWFYGFNLLCELDRPGEWYLDRERGILYFWPPAFAKATAGKPAAMKDGDVTVSVIRDPITFENTSHLTFQGFTIEATRGTAIRVTGGKAVTIAGCTIRNVGGDAVRVAGGSRHTVCDCDIHDTGDGGIDLDGGDRRTLTPGRHEAVNNHIHHIARWNPLYKVGIQLKGCGNRAAHNRLHDLSHTAIGFTGNDQTVEFNEIYQSVSGANDAGAIYTTGHHPEDWSMRGHRVRYNYLHHLFGFAGEGCQGIYLDDMFSGTEIHGNVLYRVALGFLLGGGRDILSTNNVFVKCPKAISLDARAIGWAAHAVPEVLDQFKTMPYREEPWASRYPELVNLLDDEPVLPKGNVIARNIVRGGFGIWVEAAAKPGLRMEKNLLQDDPHFVDGDRLDFRLRVDSPALKLGFEPLPLEQIGLRAGSLRKSLPPRRLFEAEAVIESPPILRAGQPVRPGVIRLRVRNIGDETDTGVIRLTARSGRLEEFGAWTCTLAPFETAERRYELWAAAGKADKIHLDVLREGVEGVIGVGTLESVDETIAAWPEALNVSELQPGAGQLNAVDRVPPAECLQWRRHAVLPDSHFCDLHEVLQTVGEEDAVVWIGSRVRCAEPMRVAVRLGYDGPVKLFVDGVAVFHDPAGKPPAKSDMAAPEVALTAGDHELALALGACQGKAWGVFLRLQRTDLAGGATPVLPEISW
jgi:hypothetical protein